MIGGLPDSTARGIGEAIVHTVEVLALISVLCVVGAGVCLILARRSAGVRAKVLRWLAVLLAVLASGPPLFIILATSR